MENIKLVVVGDGTVGKTSLLVSYVNNEFPKHHVATVFDNYSKSIRVDDFNVFLNLWDTAGQEEFDRMRSLSYQDVDIFLICYSIASPDSYENVRLKWSLEAKHFSPATPIILVGTKSDLREDAETLEFLQKKGKKMVTPEEGRLLQQQINAERFIECSAKTQTGLYELFDEAVRVVLRQRHPQRCCTIL